MTTPTQVAALKYMISKAEPRLETDPAVMLAKRILFFLIDESEGFTKALYVTLWQDREGYTADEIAAAAHVLGNMQGRSDSTHLNELLKLAGTYYSFTLHYGHVNEVGKFDTLGQFPGYVIGAGITHPANAPSRYTFFLGPKRYNPSGSLIPVDRAKLEAIDINGHGLYPDLKSSAA